MELENNIQRKGVFKIGYNKMRGYQIVVIKEIRRNNQSGETLAPPQVNNYRET